MTEFVHLSKLESVEELPGSSAETAKYRRRAVFVYFESCGPVAPF